MAGETVRPERDHYVGIEFAEHPGREVDQNLTVDVCQFAVWVVKTSGLGERQMLTRSPQLSYPGCCQGRPGRRASRPGSGRLPLGQTHHPHVSPSTRVLARVPPTQRFSSSGCAKTPSTRGGRWPAVLIATLCATESNSSLPLRPRWPRPSVRSRT